jgi:hypothetical protein
MPLSGGRAFVSWGGFAHLSDFLTFASLYFFVYVVGWGLLENILCGGGLPPLEDFYVWSFNNEVLPCV